MANPYETMAQPYSRMLGSNIPQGTSRRQGGMFDDLLNPVPTINTFFDAPSELHKQQFQASKDYRAITDPIKRAEFMTQFPGASPEQIAAAEQLKQGYLQQQRTDQARTVSESLKAAAVKKAVDNNDPNAVTLLQNLDPIQDREIFRQYMAKGTLQTGTKENIISSTSLMKAGYTPESVTAYAESGGDASLLKKGPEEIGEEGSSEHKARRQDLDDHSSSLQDLNDVGTLISMLEGNPDMLSGTASDLRKAYTEMTGGQDINDAIRMYVERIKNKQVIAALPPGVATDTDVAIASKGQPLANASPEYLLKWARGVQKILWYEGRYLDARLRYQDTHASLRGFHTEYRDKTAKELEKEFKANFGESETFQGTDKIEQKTISYSALP